MKIYSIAHIAFYETCVLSRTLHTSVPLSAGYTLEYAREGSTAWSATRLPGEARAHTLERLACGAAYRVRLTAHNAVGASEPSEELLVATKGGRKFLLYYN